MAGKHTEAGYKDGRPPARPRSTRRAEVKGRSDLPQEERDRLDRFLKVLANSGSYGIFAELNVAPPEDDDGDDVTVYGRNGAFLCRTIAPEDPGEFCFQPFAALTTAGARFMLALLERLVRDASGVIAFGDTDSAAIVASPEGGLVACPGGPHRLPDGSPAIHALPQADVERIRARFELLNPYDHTIVPGSVLKLETQNVAPGGTQHVLYAFAISAKRYALFTREADGPISIQARKEHGLGHLRNPVDPDAADTDWIDAVWLALIREALGERLVWPEWVNRPAVSRLSVSTPAILRTFTTLNAGKPYADRIKPTNFGLSVTVAPLAFPIGINPARFHLLAAYEKDASRWLHREWYDKYSGRAFRIGTGRNTPPDRIQVRSYRDVFLEYRVHPEPKSLGPDGTPCHRGTVGLLARRPVRAGPAVYIGKESHRHEEVAQGLVHAVTDVRQTYRDPREDPWTRYVVPLLQRLPRRLIAKRTGLAARTVQAVRNGRDASPSTQAAVTPVVLAEARRLATRKRTPPDIRALAERLCQVGLSAPDGDGATGRAGAHATRAKRRGRGRRPTTRRSR